MNQDFTVTPWDVSGKIDYKKLIEEFGTEPIDEDILGRWKRITGDVPFALRRKIFFSHRDLKWVLDRYEAGEKFVLYTGRGPSGHTHLGHLMPWMFTKYLQDAFDAPLYFQMTDDEKFMYKPELAQKDAMSFAYENALDVIALGFDPKKTRIFTDYEYSKTLYRIATEVAKKITFSTAKAVFGFDNSTNIGMIFFTAMQSAPAFLPSVEAGKNIPVLIPQAIDQDPHFRVTRDVAPKLGYYKPAAIHCTFLPGLGGSDKMSASKPEMTIYTTDDPKIAKEENTERVHRRQSLHPGAEGTGRRARHLRHIPVLLLPVRDGPGEARQPGTALSPRRDHVRRLQAGAGRPGGPLPREAPGEPGEGKRQDRGLHRQRLQRGLR